MTTKNNSQAFALIALLSISQFAFAQSFANFQSFKNYIHAFVSQQTTHRSDEDVRIDILQLNEQIALPSCTQDIQPSLSRQELSSNSNVVTLECHGSQPWKLFVPVQIQIFTQVLAAAHMIKPGETISRNDIKTVTRDKTVLYDGYFTDPAEVIGYIAHSLIPAEGVLARKNLKKVPLIQKKQNVKLILKHGTIQISMRGIAQENGFLNEQIKITNPSSHKTVTATVVGHGMAEVVY